MKKIILFILVISLFINAENSIKILAVSENGQGNLAELQLETKKGVGDIYIKINPYTRVDTQISITQANEIVCDYYDLPCKNYDFFYTLVTESPLVEGPSAGAAVGALTVLNMLNLNYDENIAVTSTISPGGLLGPISGINEKVNVAPGKVYTASNTISKNSKVVYHLDDILEDVSSYERKTINKDIDKVKYNEIMQTLTKNICSESNVTENFYAKASECFNENLKKSKNETSNLTKDQLNLQLENFEKNLDLVEIKSITDLQTMMIVKDRLNSAKELNKFNQTSYAKLRFDTAQTWMNFFNIDEINYCINEKNLVKTCQRKKKEATTSLTLIQELSNNQIPEIYSAISKIDSGDPILCISQSIDIISNINSILSSQAQKTNSNYVGIRINTIKQQILKNQQEDLMPILSISYLEYAEDLLSKGNENDAIYYLELALEHSHLKNYFLNDQKKSFFKPLEALMSLFGERGDRCNT